MTIGLQKFTVFVLAILVSWIAGATVPPTWTVNRVTLDVLTDDDGRLYYLSEGSPAYFDAAPIEQAQLDAAALRASGETPPVTEEFVSAVETRDGRTETVYYQLVARSHWGWWSLLPAAVAVILCWLTREPVTSLAAGIVSGAPACSASTDITGEVMIPSLASTNSAGVLLLYLWLLGGLMGVWSRTGAAKAFAEFMTVQGSFAVRRAPSWSPGRSASSSSRAGRSAPWWSAPPSSRLPTRSASATRSWPTSSTRPPRRSRRSSPSTRGRATCRRSSSSPGSASSLPRRTASPSSSRACRSASMPSSRSWARSC